VAALRQHIEPSERIHGVFTRAGDKPNIVPDHTVAEWYVRSPTLASLLPLESRVMAALRAGASAAECTMEVTPIGPRYSELRSNGPLLKLYRANSAARGRPVPEPTSSTKVVASTDAGNLSLRVPTIHPMVKIAPEGVSLHSADFARWAVGPEALRAAVDAATAMAMTAVDLWTRPGAKAELYEAFRGQQAVWQEQAVRQEPAFRQMENSAPLRP
ncbi:MAG: amidohydrolase, partial [Pseudonocardiaceae bacterium]